MSKRSDSRRVSVLASPAYRTRNGNPYNALLSDSLNAYGISVREYRTVDMLLRRGSIWHIHWPEHALHRSSQLRAALSLLHFTLKLVLARVTRTRIVWTVHNLHGHDASYPLLDRILRTVVARVVDGWIALSDEAADASRQAFPPLRTKPSAVVPHGHYRGAYSVPDVPHDVRKELHLPGFGPVILFFGQVRPYKNLDGLIDAFKQVPGEDCILLVAGKADADARARVSKAAAKDSRIVAHLGFVSNERLALYFEAATVTVLPYSRFLNSGAALLSLSYDTPILVPNAGSMPSLHRAVGHPWVQTYDGTLRPANLVRAIEESQAATGAAPLQAFEWSRIGQLTADFFRRLATR